MSIIFDEQKTIKTLIIYTGGTFGMVKDPETGLLHINPDRKLDKILQSI
jgi:hypothetical protein